MGKVDNSSNSHIFEQDKPIIGLFAKQPRPGRVKTRMVPPLTPQQACRLYQVAMQESVARLQATGLAVTLCYDGEQGWFGRTFPGLPLLAQRGDGLGERLTHALQALFAQGHGPVLLAGSDSPDLPADRVRQVVALLAAADVVTVPCRDGGFAVIGLRAATTPLFAEIPWSTAEVLAATRRRCDALGLVYRETESWDDLDTFADVQHLVARSPDSLTARHAAAELAELF